MSLLRSFALLALVALSIPCLRADFNRETGSYVFQNYSVKDYNAAPDSWQVAQDSRGVVWVANTGGVLEFDGASSWRKITVPGKAEVRSIAIDGSDTVYVGATGDFGVLVTDSAGARRFSSLLDKVLPQDREFGPIWRVLATPQGVYFSAKFQAVQIEFRRHRQSVAATIDILSCGISGWRGIRQNQRSRPPRDAQRSVASCLRRRNLPEHSVCGCGAPARGSPHRRYRSAPSKDRYRLCTFSDLRRSMVCKKHHLFTQHSAGWKHRGRNPHRRSGSPRSQRKGRTDRHPDWQSRWLAR